MSLLSGFLGLDKDVNKTKATETDEGAVSELLPELTLDMSDEELISLKKKAETKWEPYKMEIEKKQTENENYWMGKQFSEGDVSGHPLIDNLVFESLETFLPIATRPKADPIVDLVDRNLDPQIAQKVRQKLIKLVDDLSYNLKLKQVARYWALYLLGAIKAGYSMKRNGITIYTLRPQKLVLDPDATINEGEYTGKYIGEYKTDTASDLIERFPDKTDFITEEVKEKLGTEVQYMEWWYDDFVFWTLKDEVLGKTKNPHWNYDQQGPADQIDEMGQLLPPQTIPGENHLDHPSKPYFFLSIFNLGKHPHDDTNQIQQVIPQQDLINKRLRQIDINADNANGGIVVSGDYFTKEQAAVAQKALRKGGAIWQQTGSVNDGLKRDSGTPLPSFVYENLQDTRNELRNIFGTRGSSPQGTINEKTVGGKLQIKGQDSDRIGGGISVYLEQLSDKVFNYLVQLMYVYDDQPPQAKVQIGVKEGSMIPKDPVTQRNEAIDLWREGALDPITLFEKLEFPNAKESAQQLYLWMNDPIKLFPELAAEQQAQQQNVPSEAINYKDLPPEGQAQMAAQAGIQLDPMQIAAHSQQQQDQKAQEMALKQKANPLMQ